MTEANLRVVEGAEMDKHKALEAALGQIEKNFGKGSVMRLGKNEVPAEIEAISTGSITMAPSLRRSATARSTTSITDLAMLGKFRTTPMRLPLAPSRRSAAV